MGRTKKSFWNRPIAEIILLLMLSILKGFQYIGEQTIRFVSIIFKLIVFTASAVASVVVLPAHTLNRLIKKLQTISISLPRIPRFSFKRAKKIKVPKIKKVRIRRFRLPQAIKFFFWGFVAAGILIAIPTVSYLWSSEIPNPKILTVRDIPVTTKIFDRHGELLYEIYADQNRTPQPLSDIPKSLVNATIAIEDKNFYRHQGFSPRGIIRALYNIMFKENLQGGSTLTQQLIRSALLSQEVSIKRKLKELILSIWTERLYTKDQILEMYFNQVPYGGTAWGAEAAAQTYFGKSVKEITLAEAALLAGLPAAPTRYSPFGPHPELAYERQKEVLRRMVEDNYITDKERVDAENEKINFRRPNVSIRAPHFVMYVRDLLSQRYGIRYVEQGGLRITTTLDLNLQYKTQEIVANEVAALRSLNVGNGAALITDPKTGGIFAMVGSTDYFNIANEGNVNIALAHRQPGSTIKVVTYTAALQSGFTPATLLNDSPIAYTIPGSPVYAPVNYDGRFHGWVPLRFALGNSYNVPAVRTLAKLGLPTMIEQARKMGINSWSDTSRYGLSLTLGGGEVTMLEMGEVYGTLANGGIHMQSNPILRIEDYMGNTIEDNTNNEGNRAVTPEVSFIMSDILADNGARSAAFGANSLLTIPGQYVSVKTGTSNDKRDNWTIGYTQDFAVTVWVGNNNNAPMNPVLTSGVTGATPIWRKITDMMLTLHPSSMPATPENVVKLNCRGRDEYFVKGTEPVGGCPPIPTPSISITPTP